MCLDKTVIYFSPLPFFFFFFFFNLIPLFDDIKYDDIIHISTTLSIAVT